MRIKEEHLQNAADNIARYFEKEGALGERMRANFAELAAFVAERAAREIRMREFFSSGAQITSYFEGEISLDYSYGALDESQPLADAKIAVNDAMHIADFCKMTTGYLKNTARLQPSPLLFVGGERISGGKVSFTESEVLKKAFASLSKGHTQFSAAYVSSFTEACEDTLAGLSDFCILPIENSREGILTSVYSLIEKYELFICSVCVIESGEVSTKFALLCRNACGIIDSVKQQCITLRLFGKDDFSMSRIFIGADVIGVSCKSTVSVPLGYTDGYADVCTFCGSGEDLFSFLLYLGAKRIGYTLVGVYEYM